MAAGTFTAVIHQEADLFVAACPEVGPVDLLDALIGKHQARRWTRVAVGIPVEIQPPAMPMGSSWVTGPIAALSEFSNS